MSNHAFRALHAGLALLAVAFGAHAQTAVPATPAEWRQAAIQDIEEGARITRDNHPGMFDPANPAFAGNLDKARQEGLALAAKVDGPGAYTAALLRFNAAIGDGHAGMNPGLGAELAPAPRWPGFVVVWRETGLFIHASEPGGPAAGSQVLGCDGKPVKKLLEDNVFAFDGRIGEPGRWWSRTRNLFVDSGNPFIQLPRRCEFALNGKTYARDIAWKPWDEQTRRWRTAAYNGQTLEAGLSEPRKGLYWIAMPSYQPDEKERETYRAINKEISGKRQRFLDADAVVIDLRQNQGGSSFWSRDLAVALWGEGRVKRRMDARSARTEVWWRASPGNVEHVTHLVEELTREKQADAVEWARRNSAGMQAALARGDKFYVEKDGDMAAVAKYPAADLPTDPPPFTRPVYVIVPGQCASACLDALDVFTQFPNTVLIGAPSSADSTYMEVRTQKLHSGLASAIIPNKVYVNRARANGQVYLPAIYVNDLDWSVATFLRVVERDLARKAVGK
ncbi:S41 family peptidase [Massilia sp. TN1-12]|uniref:S41 family peptidase n=1 Tax=Massilia paldalensis TaxID=3377675 RepID=UPI00384A4D2B